MSLETPNLQQSSTGAVTIVVDNYHEYDYPHGSVKLLLTMDPWLGPNFRRIYKFEIEGTPSDYAKRRYSKTTVKYAYKQPAGGLTGLLQEPSVTHDGDGDEVYTFDEQMRFNTSSILPDTDGDDIDDFKEILSYTFNTSHVDKDSIWFPDIDERGEGLRAGLDCDTDDDAEFDGGVYFYKIQAGTYTEIRSMVLLR